MREWVRTPAGRLTVALGLTLFFAAITFTVAREALPVLPAILPALWVPLYAPAEGGRGNRRMLVLLLLAGVLALGVAVGVAFALR